MSNWIGEAFASTTGWEHLEQLVDIGNRLAGTEGEAEGAALTRDALEDVGARNVRLDSFDIQGWERGDTKVFAGGTTQEAIGLPRTPADEVSGELVDVGYGLPADFERDLDGTIVMARSDVPEWYERYIHRTEKYYYAVEAGASGFIYRNHVPGCLPPTGSVGNDEEPIGAIPAVGVSQEVGARLSRRWDGEPVTVSVDAEIGPATSHNVHADIGPDTGEAVLLTSHVDAHDIAEGAGDNGSGTALVLEAAKALITRADELETRVHCLVYGGEEVGLLGSERDAASRDQTDITAVVNNDGVVRNRTLQPYTHGFEELDRAIEDVADRFQHPIRHTPQQSPHSDHWPYVRDGTPGMQVSSYSGEQGRGWGHTAADTLDKLEPRNLREQGILVTEIVATLASDEYDPQPRPRSEIAAELEDQRLAEGMKVVGEWPYE